MDVLAGLKHDTYMGGRRNLASGVDLVKKLLHLYSISVNTEGRIGQFTSSGGMSRWNAAQFVKIGQYENRTRDPRASTYVSVYKPITPWL
ncbi:hypothetical protein F4779DRAFT_567035 [Xylariaceae sp. FL0662B]|nr:hypothetical protein F4779DRAFT_567035 [Xylariaceae sp. FL0662B]